jgi:hypothetical protein
MKQLIASTFVAMSLAFGTAACAKEEEKKAPEVKTVCIDKITKDGKPVMNKKTGKQAQDCKQMKVHKKLEGTKVPPK